MEESEDEGGGFGAWLETEPFLVRAHVVECFVDDRESDDRVDDVGVD